MSTNARDDDAPRPSEPDEGGSWRTAERFNQAERYAGAPRDGAAAAPGDRVDLRRVFLAGGAMIATTLVVSVIGFGGGVGFVAGLAVFFGVIFWTSPRRRAARQERRVAQARLDAAPGPVREAIAKAEADLAVIDDVATRLRAEAVRPGDARIADALETVAAAAREVRAAVIADPGDYDRARAFFRVLCPSMRAASEKFVALPARDDEIDARFMALATDMRAACARQLETLLADERVDLEVEIDVLAERIRGGR